MTQTSGISIDMSQKSTRLEAAGVPDRDWETDLVSFPLLAINQLCELGQKKIIAKPQNFSSA